MTANTEGYSSLISKKKILWVCLCLFFVAVGVRFLVWQNNKADIEHLMSGVTQAYLADANTLLSGDLYRFIAGSNPPVDTSILAHPPGYPIFIVASLFIFGEAEAVRVVQIAVNSFAPVIVFIFALGLVGYRPALISGMLVAVAPQPAYYAGILLPDGLSVLPILLAVYFFSRTVKNHRLSHALLSGVMIGLSCWLRANAMLLPFFLAFLGILYWPRGTRLKLAGSVVLGFLLTIAPLTIRNYVVFDAFVPVSSGGGHNFIAGLVDFDNVGHEELPRGPLDEDAMRYEAELYGRPDYYGNNYAPDGIQRERDRFSRGLTVVLRDPVWFGRIVLYRAVNYFLRFERVPVIAPERDERATTPAWLYWINRPLKIFQRPFITAVLTPLFLAGAAILLWRRRFRALGLIIIVPIYYMMVQSLVHTEYRYVLASPHLQLILVGVMLSTFVETVIQKYGDRLPKQQMPSSN